MKFSKTFIYASIVLVLVVVLWYFFSGKRSTNEYFMTSGCEGTDKSFTMIAFFMDGCGHCTKFKPEWAKFSAQAASQPWGSKVCLAEMSGDDPDTMAKYNVQAFPTVLLFNNGNIGKNGNPEEFNGPRTVDGLNAFVKKIVN
jgi:thioredoxin-like negative regulator of GroEL